MSIEQRLQKKATAKTTRGVWKVVASTGAFTYFRTGRTGRKAYPPVEPGLGGGDSPSYPVNAALGLRPPGVLVHGG